MNQTTQPCQCSCEHGGKNAQCLCGEPTPLRIGVIVASNRPVRFGGQIADWVKKTTDKDQAHTYTYLDLADIDLPFLAEPKLPSAGDYTLKTTKQWSAQIAEQDGFLLVLPEYNHSFPASMKNALDTLYSEWNMKPFGFVGYGSLGAARSIEALSGVILNLGGVPLTNKTTSILLFEQLDKTGTFVPSERNQQALDATLAALHTWARVLKAGRTC